jgi:hypothetical protein
MAPFTPTIRRRLLATATVLATASSCAATGSTGPTITTEPVGTVTSGPSTSTSTPPTTTTTSTPLRTTTTPPTTTTTTSTTTPPPPPSTPPPTRAPSEHSTPAAGVCFNPEGGTASLTSPPPPASATGPATFVIGPDNMPTPRCIVAGVGHHLRFVNNSNQTVTATLADIHSVVPPGQSVDDIRPFGNYLEPGVHTLTWPPFDGGGADLVIVAPG